jgi:hypothetical protein
VRVLQDAFLVQAKTKDGNPILMTVGPNGVSALEFSKASGATPDRTVQASPDKGPASAPQSPPSGRLRSKGSGEIRCPSACFQDTEGQDDLAFCKIDRPARAGRSSSCDGTRVLDWLLRPAGSARDVRLVVE